MSTSPTLSMTTLIPTPTSTATTVLALSINTDVPSTTYDPSPYNPSYNYFFILIALAALIIVGSLVGFIQSRKKKKSRSQRETLIRDVATWPRGVVSMSRYISRRRTRDRDSILEAGLDERGEAPPPYGVAERDRPPSIGEAATEPMAIGQWRTEVPVVMYPTTTGAVNTNSMVEFPVDTSGALLQPPGYGVHELPGHYDRTRRDVDIGTSSPRRPPAAMIATDRFLGS